MPDVAEDIERKNDGFNLVLWLVEPPANMAMLTNIADMTTLRASKNKRKKTHHKETHT